MKVCTYNRWSKKDRSPDGIEALKRQRWQTSTEAKKHAEEFLEFVDIQTGRRDDRPDFQKLISLIAARQIDLVIITRVDRLSRDIETNARLAKMFEKTGVKIHEILLGRTIDWKNPNDWEYFVRAGVKAEGESRMLSARVNQTFEYLRHQGKVAGGGIAFGYMRFEGKHMPHPEDWDKAIELIKVIIAEGGSTTRATHAAQELGFDCTRAGLYGWIRCQTIRGNTKYKDTVKPGTHPSLFDAPALQEINAAEAVEQIISQAGRMRGRNRYNRQYPLSGLVFCGRCGSAAHIKTVKHWKYPENTYTYIMCGQRSTRASDCGGKYGSLMGQRNTVNTHYSEAEGKVIAALKQAAKEAVDRSIAMEPLKFEESAEAKQLRSQIAALEAMNDPDLKPVIDLKQSQLRALLGELVRVPEQRKRESKLAEYFATDRFWEIATDSEKTKLYQEFVERVECDRYLITVKLRI